MKHSLHFLMILIVSILLVGCDLIHGLSTLAATPTLTTTPIPVTPTKASMSVERIQQAPDQFKDQLVKLRGYGVTVLTAPLCPGYVGRDTRFRFVDAEEKSIVAVWQPSARPVERQSSLRTFEGYIRIFEGQIGCPGSVHDEMFPYFEIVQIE